ncbi:FAD/NAD(P)-binding domain-containing protein [Leucogyrophana mollusca]|uniref:FAD/NAD(P)-binding domain-containing protein n=1 Tax=Leucogyrophana mollusca TaxID=85980 RepID=A0ACB8B9C9_9AGAM|nr:FAD/NAD(P)-binding domain-containing protein [Leucogyrophana mollusca]
MSVIRTRPLPKRILIIGGGPCGLVTLRNCLQHGELDDVQLVERRDNIGGVWYQDDRATDHDDRPRWTSPAYPGLIGNVLPEFLSFSGYPFPPPPREDQPFPTLPETFEYLQQFSRPLFETGRIRLNTEVVQVNEMPGLGGGWWRVLMKDWGADGAVIEEIWDAVVVTTVWFDNAHFPDTPGLDDIKNTEKIQHAITWKGPDGYGGKRVVVIGNANSANEIAAQLAPVAQTPVYRSTRRVSIFPSLPDSRIQDVGPVTRYSTTSTANGERIAVHFKDGPTIEDVDTVVFGTGYHPDVPYLRVVDHSVLTTDSSRGLVRLTSRTIRPARVPSLYRHVLYGHNPTLAFIGAAISFIPFSLADLTSTWLVLAWSGKIPYPESVAERLCDEKDRLDTLKTLRERTDNPSDLVSFHFLGGAELAYAQKMRAEVVQALPDLVEHLATWDDEQDSRRWGMYGTKLKSLYAQNGRRKES